MSAPEYTGCKIEGIKKMMVKMMETGAAEVGGTAEVKREDEECTVSAVFC